MTEPDDVTTLPADRVTERWGNPPAVTSTPRGSIHDKPLGVSPKGMVNPSAETDVVEAAPKTKFAVAGKAAAAPVTALAGAAPDPSHPRVMLPSGARRVPRWSMLAAINRRLPPAESGAPAAPEESTVIDPATPESELS